MEFDTIIIGAGMSGLAAGIRLAMFGKSVCILEKHSIAGGLNSFYQRKGRKFDVGLHALTNYANKGERGRPLTKLLKQLRIPHGEFSLSEQQFSRITFPGHSLKFTNNIDALIEEISEKFPNELNNFNILLDYIKDFDETNLNNPYESAKDKFSEFIEDEKLKEMIFCPLLIYGSAWEDDMDFSQFVIMFKSIFLEGLSRPEGGVRRILDLLLSKFKNLGGELRFRSAVEKIEVNDNKVSSVHLKNGEILKCNKVLSSMGLPETFNIVSEEQKVNQAVGRMSFTETILCYDKKPQDFKINETLVFYNENEKYNYHRPKTAFDSESAVICLPNNFQLDDLDEGVLRLTFMANYDIWEKYDKVEYKIKKEEVLEEAKRIISEVFPEFDAKLLYHDVFTPLTIKKFTGHISGNVYGSTKKSRDGRTNVDGLFICGTDQGFLGIIGSMLSGISMANLHCLMEDTSISPKNQKKQQTEHQLEV